jgi:hypothetical protein
MTAVYAKVDLSVRWLFKKDKGAAGQERDTIPLSRNGISLDSAAVASFP